MKALGILFLISIAVGSVHAAGIKCQSVADLGALPFPFKDGFSFEIEPSRGIWTGPARFEQYDNIKAISFRTLTPTEAIIYANQWGGPVTKGLWLSFKSVDYPADAFLGIANIQTYTPEDMNFPNSKFNFLLKDELGNFAYSGMSMRCFPKN